MIETLGLRKPLMLSTNCQVLIFIVGPISSGALSAIGTSGCNHWKMANIADAASIKKKKKKPNVSVALSLSKIGRSIHCILPNQSLKDLMLEVAVEEAGNFKF